MKYSVAPETLLHMAVNDVPSASLGWNTYGAAMNDGDWSIFKYCTSIPDDERNGLTVIFEYDVPPNIVTSMSSQSSPESIMV